MIKSNNFKALFIFILFPFIYSCADTRISWKAQELGCFVPSANIAFVEISKIQSTGTTRDIAGILKYTKYIFKNSILDLEDRCKHSKVVINSLEKASDFEPNEWNSENKNTSGKVIIFSTRDYAKKVCRDYYTYIDNGKKRYGYRGTACAGASDALAQFPDLISKIGYWHFYDYYPNQLGSTPVKPRGYISLQFNPLTPDIRRQLFKFNCNREPWQCR